MSYPMEVKKIQPQAIITIRRVVKTTELSNGLAEILPAVGKYLHEQNIERVAMPFARYHSFTPDTVDVEAGSMVAAPAAGEGEIKSSELPGGRVLSVMFMGHYANLMDGHKAAADWMKENGEAQSGPHWEIYWTDPGQEPDPKDWKTELVFPL